MLSRYNDQYYCNVYIYFRDGLMFAAVNTGTSIYAGIVIFSVLGFMAGKQGVPVGDVAKSGRCTIRLYIIAECMGYF